MRPPPLSRRFQLSRQEGEALAPSSKRSDGAARRARRRRWGFALLLASLLVGFASERAGLLDWRTGVTAAEGYADRWWLAPTVALVTAALFAAGLPGSLMLFVAGILFPLTVAAPVFVVGAVVGSLVAYTLARVVGQGGTRERGDGRLLQLLSRQGDFPTLLAVRLVPSFPHSAINFAAGFLGISRGRFLASTALGLSIKGTLYITAIHQAAEAATIESAISWRSLAPLAGLALLLLVVPALLRRRRAEPAAHESLTIPVEPA